MIDNITVTTKTLKLWIHREIDVHFRIDCLLYLLNELKSEEGQGGGDTFINNTRPTFLITFITRSKP